MAARLSIEAVQHPTSKATHVSHRASPSSHIDSFTCIAFIAEDLGHVDNIVIHYTVVNIGEVLANNDLNEVDKKLSCCCKRPIKADIALHGNPISELRDVTCHMGSHSVTRHLTQVNAPRLTSAIQAGTRFTYPGGMEG